MCLFFDHCSNVFNQSLYESTGQYYMGVEDIHISATIDSPTLVLSLRSGGKPAGRIINVAFIIFWIGYVIYSHDIHGLLHICGLLHITYPLLATYPLAAACPVVAPSGLLAATFSFFIKFSHRLIYFVESK